MAKRLSSVAKLQPMLVVMDIGMPSLDGMGATRVIKAQYRTSPYLDYRSTPTHQVDSMLKATGALQRIDILEEKPPAALPDAQAPKGAGVLHAQEPKR